MNVGPTSASIDAERIIEALDYHRLHPHVSIEEHIRQRRETLGLELANRKVIYLDTRYWIFLRDAALGRPGDPLHTKLLEVLQEGVSNGSWLCPISDTTFFEVIHIGDVQKRLDTARIIQALSLGTTLCPEHERVCCEILQLLHGYAGDKEKLRRRVWLKLSYVLGAHVMRDQRFSGEDQLVLGKSFFDHLWDVSLPEMLTTIGDDCGGMDFPYACIAGNLNTANAAHADEVGSFKATYLDEIAGVLDLYKDFAADVLKDMFVATGSPLDQSAQERANSEREVCGFLIAMARGGKGAVAFPTLHVSAKLHAAIRRDKSRRFDRNDLPDFHHAAAALVYCDAFLTEGPLRSMIQSGNVKLDSEFGCSVIASEETAIEWLTARLR